MVKKKARRNLPWGEATLSRESKFTVAVLPVPPSGNDAYRKGRWGMYSSGEWSEYLRKMKLLKTRFKHVKKITEPTEIKLVIRWYRHRKAGDLTNREKTAEDALQGVLYDNDRQVRRKESERFDTFEGSPRIEVEVHLLSGQLLERTAPEREPPSLG